MCALTDLCIKINTRSMQASRAAAAVRRSTLGRGGRHGAGSRGEGNVGPELGMRDGLRHQKHYFCFVLALLMWCGGFRNEPLEHGDQVLCVLALLARALGLDTHFFQLELLAIRLSKRCGWAALFHFVDGVFKQFLALLGMHLLQCLLVISRAHVLAIGALCFLHSFLNCCSAFEKVRTGTATHAGGPIVEVNVQVHGMELIKLVCASPGNVFQTRSLRGFVFRRNWVCWIVSSHGVEISHAQLFLHVGHLLARGNLAVLVQNLVKQRGKVVTAHLDHSFLLVRYRRLLGLAGDLHDAERDGLFWRDCSHELPMLVSPVVLFLHPLDPLLVGRVEG